MIVPFSTGDAVFGIGQNIQPGFSYILTAIHTDSVIPGINTFERTVYLTQLEPAGLSKRIKYLFVLAFGCLFRKILGKGAVGMLLLLCDLLHPLEQGLPAQ